jgi:cysteine synthase
MDIQSGMLDRAQIKAQSAMLTNIRFLQAAVGFLPPLLDRSLYDKTRGFPESAARKMCRRLAKEEGLFVGTSSGLNVVAALSLASELGPDKTVVTVACDTGLKYTAGDLFSDG